MDVVIGRYKSALNNSGNFSKGVRIKGDIHRKRLGGSKGVGGRM